MGSEETSEVTKVGKEVCQERLVCQVSGSRAVNRKGCQGCQQQGLSRFRDVKSKSDREKVASSEEEVERKKCRGEKDVQTNSRQQEGLSRRI